MMCSPSRSWAGSRARGPPARDRSRLPGPLVRARRGKPPLPPLPAAGPARGRHETGWELVRASYFNSLLLLPAAVVRLARRGRGDPTHSELSFTPPWLDPVLTLPLRLESAFSAHRRPAARRALRGRPASPPGRRAGNAGPTRQPRVRTPRPRSRSEAVAGHAPVPRFCVVGVSNTAITFVSYAVAVAPACHTSPRRAGRSRSEP